MECNSTNFNSIFSFRPLINTWKELAENGREGSRQLYSELLEKVSQVPELLLPITDESVIEKNRNLIEQMMATIFPVTLSDKEDIYGTLIPFKLKVIYGSERFRNLFLGSTDSRIIMPDIHNPNSLEKEKLIGAYQLILSRLYNVPIPDIMTTVHSYSCPDTTLDRYMELEIDTRFVNVVYKGDLPPLSAECLNGWMNGYEIPDIPGIQQAFTLENFEFEGMVIFNLKDVTEREVYNIIRNRLLQIDNFSDATIFSELQRQIQNLVSVPGAQTAIKPFYRVNDHLVISELYTKTNVPRELMLAPEKVNELYNVVMNAFKDAHGPKVIPYITEELIKKYPFMDLVVKMGYKSAIMCPLFTSSKVMIGMVMVMSDKENQFTWKHVAKLEPAIPLFKLALEKTQQDLDHQVDRVIKDQFTAVQDAVEWRFTETALNYLISKHRGEQTKIDPITFNHVYPLYGAIDIRNSSVERNLAIQQDMLEQLRLAQNIIKLAKQQTSFPLLDEILFKLKKFIHAVNNILFADEEIAIHHFLKTEIVNMFTHIQSIIPSLDSEIKVYLNAIDSPVEMLYNHRKSYEESITTINNEVARFIDEEQKAAQKIFPHYFERFVTDGVDFNIYIGQSITPDKKFDFFYLKNLKIWQLNTLAKAAILTNKLEKKLKVQLQTSQLILAHSQPISISFRTAERKFDVDGAYNIRYEIIKKRIDKVHIKDSNERLTQPGMLAIVYSQTHEANEYLEYIDFLQNQGLLTGEVEKFDLEDLQGVSGMRGLRVGINFNEDIPETHQSKQAGSISN
jgi:hypothetical protein